MSIKRILGFAKNEFIYGGHIPSFVAIGISFTIAMLLKISITVDFLIITYLIFYVIYSYNRLKEFDRDFLTNFKRTKHIKNYINYLPFVIFCSVLIITFLLCYLGNIKSTFLGFLILVLGLLYTIYFKGITKKIVGFKSFYIAFVWSLLILFLALYYSFPTQITVFLILLFVLLRVLLNTSFFDIKDVESDRENKLKTIPIFLGKDKTIKYLHILNAVSFAPIIIGVYGNILPLISLSLIIFFFYSFYYLQRTRNKKADIHNLSYIMVDGEYLLWPIVLFFSKLIFKM